MTQQPTQAPLVAEALDELLGLAWRNPPAAAQKQREIVEAFDELARQLEQAEQEKKQAWWEGYNSGEKWAEHLREQAERRYRERDEDYRRAMADRLTLANAVQDQKERAEQAEREGS